MNNTPTLAALNRGQLSAVILAAGRSSRMEEFKPLLTLGGVTLLERAVGLFRNNGVTDVLVVAGYRAADLLPAARGLGARCVVNERYEQGMFSSVTTAVQNLTRETRGFFLLPVDIPLVRPHTVRRLKEAWQEKTCDILYPVFLGERGHPPLISCRYREEILGWNGPGGLRAVLEKHASDARQIEVADRFILLDMDTPDDFAAMQQRQSRASIPNIDECRSLLTRIFRLKQSVIDHSRRVAQVALRLARALDPAGCTVENDLLMAAALLHDIAKGQSDHAAVGAGMLSDLGFPAVARVAACHMDIIPRLQGPPDERELLYLADKMVDGSRVADPEKRFAQALNRYAGNALTVNAIEARKHSVAIIGARVEKILGRSVFDVVSTGEEQCGGQGAHLLDEAW